MLIKNCLPVCIILFFTTIVACSNDKDQKTAEEKDLVDFSRFEQDLFAEGKKDAIFIEQLRKKHGSFTDLILGQVIGLKAENDSLLAVEAGLYTADKYINEVYSEVSRLYKDDEWLRESFNEGFAHFKKQFPGKLIPAVKTFIAPFNYNTVASDSVLGIGLDMYLGSDFKYYPTAGFPMYKIRKLSREYIISDAFAAWLQSDYQPDPGNNDLLNNMVHEGKILYAVNELLPDVHDTIKYGFSELQWQWCQDNEENLWKFFLEQKLLFNKNTGEYIKYINDGATTSGFPKEAPARLGVFIGLKIVQSYMEKNNKVTLQQLMEFKDGGRLLIESGYKPSN
jgi:hypothetical protein